MRRDRERVREVLGVLVVGDRRQAPVCVDDVAPAAWLQTIVPGFAVPTMGDRVEVNEGGGRAKLPRDSLRFTPCREVPT